MKREEAVATGRRVDGSKREGAGDGKREGWCVATRVVEGREVQWQGCAAPIPCCKKKKIY